MNNVTKELIAYLEHKLNKAEASLTHEGVSILDGAPGRGSGRYPLGSGENPGQHGSGDLLTRIEKLQKMGYTDAEVADMLGIEGRSGKSSSARLRAIKSILKEERNSALIAEATRLRDQGLSYQAIAEKMGYKNDSSIRNLLNEDRKNKRAVSMVAADILRENVDKYGMLDVGKGSERYLGNGVSAVKLNEALEILKEEGYIVYGGGIPQVTNPGQQSNQLVLCKPGTPHSDIYKFDQIHTLAETDKKIVSIDGKDEIVPPYVYPESLSSKRVAVRYAEDGGVLKDGVVELRRGVEDISLGGSHYSQVRILVDGTHYIKGMAVYSDNLPDGVDVLFNTNKKKGTPMLGPDKENSVLKPISKKDPNNPFGALIKQGVYDPDRPDKDIHGGQSYYYDENGNKKLRVINKRADEGDWNEWADKLPAQFLAKQSTELAKRQLKLAHDAKMEEYELICSLDNPTVKRRLLKSFAESCDSSAVDLKAAALPRQKYQVILPLTTIRDDEVYAPNYRDGEKVALVRYPHEGTFQIAICTVNNKQREGSKVIGPNGKDAVGISQKTADKLSGADFDGDTVMVIPTHGSNGVKITARALLKDLEGYDPKTAYPKRDGMKVMRNTQNEMGKISNLITDMTLKGAKDEELARAVKHSMCVIDAEKHELDYKRSEAENDIKGLKKIYQQKTDGSGRYGGASTLISRASGEKDVDKRQGSPKINQKGKPWYDPSKPQGSLLYKTADDDKLYYQKDGKTHKRTQKSTQMAETDDARTLISDYNTPMERLYADYANSMKSLANSARLKYVETPRLQYSTTAAKYYKTEVDSLNYKLNESEKNAVKERAAQRLANNKSQAQKAAFKEAGLTDKEVKKELKKANQRYLVEARVAVGAKRTPIDITDREWEAIQAGAISDSKLEQILKHVDTDKVKERSMPRESRKIEQWQINKAKWMAEQDYTNEQIADALGISASSVSKYL